MERAIEKGEETKVEEIKQFDIWVCNFDGCGVMNDAGVRPCIIVSNNSCNLFSPVVTVVPLTTSAKKPMPTHCIISTAKVMSIAMCEKIVSIDREKLGEKVGTLNEFEKTNITYCLKQQLGIE